METKVFDGEGWEDSEIGISARPLTAAWRIRKLMKTCGLLVITSSAIAQNYGTPGPGGPIGSQGPIARWTSDVNRPPSNLQMATQTSGTSLNIGDLLPSTTPFKCVEAYLSADILHGGTDYGIAISAAVQASNPTSVTEVKTCVPGDHPVYTTAVFDRPIAFHMDGQSRLVPQSSMASTPVNIMEARATAGSPVVSMPSTSGLSIGMACGGVGIQPGAYIVSKTSSAITLSLASRLEFYGVATAASTTLRGVSSLSGLARAQLLTGTGANWPFAGGSVAISSVNFAANTISVTTAAAKGSPVPDSFIVDGSWLSNLSCVKQTPVLLWQYNMLPNEPRGTPSLHNQYDYQIGASMRDVWIADNAGPNRAGRTLPGVQGVQISGYDGFSSTNLRVDNLSGSGLILGGYVPGQLNNSSGAVRESGFIHDQIRNSGDPKTGQGALAILTPFESGAPTADEINEIELTDGHYVCSAGNAVVIGTFNTGHGVGGGPGGIFFDSGFQIEGCPQGFFDTPAQSDAIFVENSNSLRFSNGSISIPGQGKSLLHLERSAALTMVNTSLYNQSIPVSYTVSVTKGSSAVTYISGGGIQHAFNTTQSWDGIGVQIGSTLMHLAPLSPVESNGLTLRLASPWTATSGTSTQTMVVGYGGAFLMAPDTSLFRVDIRGVQTTGNLSQTNALLGVGNNNHLFEVGNNFDGSAGALNTYDDFDGIRTTEGPTQYRLGGAVDTTKPGFQANFDLLGLGETDYINTNAGLLGGHCFFNLPNNAIPGHASACIMGENLVVTPQTDTYGIRITPSSDANVSPDIYGTNAANDVDNWLIGRAGAYFKNVNTLGYSFNGVAGFTGTKTVGTCVFTIQGGIITKVTGC